MPRRKLKQSVTPAMREAYRDWCIEMESSGNHGGYGSAPGWNPDVRRGITFWGTGRGWQLYKGWRNQWAKTFPDMPLPDPPEPEPKVKRVTRAQLNALWAEYQSYDRRADHLGYDERAHDRRGRHVPGWFGDYVVETTRNGEPHYEWRTWYLGSNSNEAKLSIEALINKWKEAHDLSGMEPGLGDQPERTYAEPMISRTGQGDQS